VLIVILLSKTSNWNIKFKHTASKKYLPHNKTRNKQTKLSTFILTASVRISKNNQPGYSKTNA